MFPPLRRRDSLDADAAARFVGVWADAPIVSIRIERAPIPAGSPFIGMDDFIAPRIAGTRALPPKSRVQTSAFLSMVAGIATVAARQRWTEASPPR